MEAVIRIFNTEDTETDEKEWVLGSWFRAPISSISSVFSVLSLLAASVCTGCAGGGGPGSPASRGDAVAASVVLGVPSGPGADVYTTRVEAAGPSDALAAQFNAQIQASRRKQGHSPILRDGRLDRVANDIALLTGESEIPSFDTTSTLLAHYGVVEPDPGMILKRGENGSEPEAVANLEQELASNAASSEWRRFGVAVKRTPGQWMAVLIFQGKNLDIEPVPRRIPSHGHATIAGQIRAKFHSPEVLVTPPHGTVQRLATSVKQGNFTARLDCSEGDGAYQVEVIAQDASGPGVLANFPVCCGAELRTPVLTRSAQVVRVTDPALAERQIIDLLDRDRLVHGLPVLVRDPRLARIAQRYSREMAETGEVAHTSRRSGSTSDRIRAAGLSPLPTYLGENVGSALSAAEVELGFMSSPGHRENILNRALTHVGVGVAVGREEGGTVPLYVTQVFAGWGQ